MDCPIKIFTAFSLIVASFFLSGCISYQISRYVEGNEVAFPNDRLQVGKTTLGMSIAKATGRKRRSSVSSSWRPGEPPGISAYRS